MIVYTAGELALHIRNSHMPMQRAAISTAPPECPSNSPHACGPARYPGLAKVSNNDQIAGQGTSGSVSVLCGYPGPAQVSNND